MGGPGGVVAPRTLEAVRHYGGPRPRESSRHLELRGGEAVRPDALPSTLPLDWQDEVTAFVAATCRDHIARGAGWLTLPPVLLMGGCQAERLHVARQVAAHAGLPHFVWEPGASPLPGSPAARDVRLPCPPVMAMLAAGCANPVVSVIGLHAASGAVAELVAGMLDPVAARRWTDPALEAVVDLGQVSWIIGLDDSGFTAGTIEDRCVRVRMHPIRWTMRPAVVASLTERALADLGMEGQGAAMAPVDAARLANLPVGDFEALEREVGWAVQGAIAAYPD